MTGLTAICAAVELPANPAPDWVHLLPLGAVNGRDGRRWSLDDPAQVIARSADGGDLPIDYDHESEKPKTHGGPLPAAGWIKGLQARADGIWGKVEWTKRAAGLIANREYRFLSPVLHYHPSTGQVLRLIGAGLVHRPNLALTALSEQEKIMPDMPADTGSSAALAEIAAALDLREDDGLDAILSAIKARIVPDPSRYVPIEAVADLLKQRNSVSSDHAMRTAEAKVEQAMNAGYLTPAMRPGPCRSARRILTASKASSPRQSLPMRICTGSARCMEPLSTCQERRLRAGMNMRSASSSGCRPKT